MSLLLGDLRLDVSQHLRVDGRSESGNGIPSLGGVEPLAVGVASSLGTDVITVGDIGEGGRVGGGHLVQERGDEAEGLSGLAVDVVVEEGDDTGNNGGGSGSPTDGLNLVLGENKDLRTEGGDIRESSAIRVVVTSWRKLNSRLEIVGNSGSLMCRNGGDIGETTTRGEIGLRVAYTLLSTGGSAVLSGTSRRRVGEIGPTGSSGDLGGSNRGDVRGGGREDWVEVVLGARRISTTVSSRISGSADKGNSLKTDLLELSVDTLNILGVVKTHLLALSATDTVLALVLLVPSIGDGVDERNILGGEHVAGESVQPDVVFLNPEPSLSTEGDSEDVLDIEGGLDLGVGRIIVTNDVVGGKRGNVDAELRGEVGKIGRRVVLVLKLDDSSGGVTGDLSSSGLIDGLDGLGGDGDQNLGISGLLEGEARSRELAKSGHELYVLSKVVRNRERAKLANDLSA